MPTNGEVRFTEAIRTLRAGGAKNRADGVTGQSTVFSLLVRADDCQI